MKLLSIIKNWMYMHDVCSMEKLCKRQEFIMHELIRIAFIEKVDICNCLQENVY